MSKIKSLVKQFQEAIQETKRRVLDVELVKKNMYCAQVFIPLSTPKGEIQEVFDILYRDKELMKNIRKISDRGSGYYTVEPYVEDFHHGEHPAFPNRKKG